MNKFDELLKERDLTDDELMDFEYFCWSKGYEARFEGLEFGKNRRWFREVVKVYQVNEQETGERMGFYAIQYDEGLTEMQEDSYLDQPYKVRIKYKLEMVPKIERIDDSND